MGVAEDKKPSLGTCLRHREDPSDEPVVISVNDEDQTVRVITEDEEIVTLELDDVAKNYEVVDQLTEEVMNEMYDDLLTL